MKFAQTLRALLMGATLSMVLALAHAGPKEDIVADMQAGRWNEAEQRLVVVLQKHPNNALAHYWRAQVKAKLGDIGAAREELASAKRIDPDGTFASKPETLRSLEAYLAPPAPQVEQQLPTEPIESALNNQAPEQQEARDPLVGLKLAGLLAVGLVTLAIVVASAMTMSERRKERRQWRDKLDELERDITDAMAFSDGNADFSPETRLNNYDRAGLAKRNVQTHRAELDKRTDFEATQQMVTRLKDVVAEIRGEEPPTQRKARQQREQSQRYWDNLKRHQARQSISAPAPAPAPVASSDRSLLSDALLVGAGVMLANSVSAAPAQPQQSQSTSALDIDTGGSVSAWSGTVDTGSPGAGDTSFG